ncbi:MAG: aspartate carbamoyltransferase catalytic subunit [Gemmatimonadota bacterium]|nr:aspartate carbamoyltransferase catalytic subunit [Gemmatimonadota bacterium]MDP6528743.1 aspartate carbamoyltransferase catalytic subunit [Gemmatimonadota bacterium]MDP6803200.1 aspartate carbamoyltransferase catalytic subunit [Gemmatimonadota bacterium]MDP7031262.1 aspartate carbamoyltransferase catalytic subunit [Gemmatimonadota bacterium]
MIAERKSLLGIRELAPEEIVEILDSAESFREVLDRSVKKVPALRGTTIANLFFENSTRTRSSFELAEKRLSADVLNFSASGSSVAKGETLRDTAQNIEAMNVDIIVMRHGSSGACHFLDRQVRARVVNAGDGLHEHPTQALLDAFTLRETLGKIEGLRVVILGDISHSRVARSNIFLLTKLGARVTVCGPPTMLPPEVESLGVTATTDVRAALRDADAVNVLRIQFERQAEPLIPGIREYADHFGISEAKLADIPDGITVLHPGPMNRGTEISHEVAELHADTILRQVSNGVAVRMAVLYLLSGAGGAN